MTSIVDLLPSRRARVIDSAPLDLHPGQDGLVTRLNSLRAGVLGANDGIVSVAAIVVGVAGATANSAPILAAGVAGLVGGAVSMALGEYVSVSSQRDSQRAMIDETRRDLAHDPAASLDRLARIYKAKGLSAATAHRVAVELTEQDALGAHLEASLHLDEDDVASPWHAAVASAVAFTLGGLLPLASILLLPASVRIPVTFLAVLFALALTGATSARIGGSSVARATVRVVIGGAVALAATWIIGHLLGASGIL